jgi:hypothetical protein
MPFGYAKNRIMRESYYILEQSIKLGYNFSPRLHIMLHGNKTNI